MLREMAVIALVAASACLPVRAGVGATWELGILGGGNMSRFGGDTAGFSVTEPGLGTITTDVNQWQKGFVGGLSLSVYPNDVLGFRVEALATMKGSKGDMSAVILNFPVEGEFLLNINYVEIPVLIVAALPVGETVRLRLMWGIALAYRIDAEGEIRASLLGLSDSETFDADDLFKDTDFSGVIGAEFAFDAGRLDILLGARGTFGVTNVVEENTVDISLKNQALSFTLGLGIPLGPQ